MTSNIHDLAVKAKEELQRRGRTRGDLGQLNEAVGETPGGLTIFSSVPEEDCRVCLIGALSSAFNPHHPFEPGYGYDVEGDTDSYWIKDPEYRAFTDAVIAELPDGLIGPGHIRTVPGKRRKKFIDVMVLAKFNDARHITDDDVFALLDRVIEKHK